MADAENVLKALKICRTHNNCGGCPYAGKKCEETLYDDAAEVIRTLMEERESVNVICVYSDVCGSIWYGCGACKSAINHNDNYCRYCGKRVKWDA